MTDTCKIQARIEEVERMLKETNSNKQALEKRLAELKVELTPELEEIANIFKGFHWYGFVSANHGELSKDRIYVVLKPTNELHWNGVSPDLNRLGYYILSMEDYKDVEVSGFRYRAPTKVVLAKRQ